MMPHFSRSRIARSLRVSGVLVTRSTVTHITINTTQKAKSSPRLRARRRVNTRVESMLIRSRETMLELRDERGVTIAGGAEFEATRARPRVLDAHRKEFQFRRFAEALEPFDCGDR